MLIHDLRHTQIQTTQRYAHLSDEHVHAAAAQVSERTAASLNRTAPQAVARGSNVVKLAEFKAPD